MADYYSLLSRAVAALPQAAPEARQAVYERARKALLNQLRSIRPPVAESDIAAEGRALEQAIARVEAEAGNKPESDQTEDRAKPARAGQPVSAGSGAAEAATPETSPRERQRPAAPQPLPPEAAGGSRRLLAIAAIVVVLAGLVALAAWQFRERPEDLVRSNPGASVEDSPESGKIADRVGDGDQDRAPSSSTRAADGASREPTVPVAQKAELLVAAPEEANKVKTYPGSVVWRLDNVGGGPGQPLASAIRGDIDIPDAKLKLMLVFQKNLDATLSASHTINVSFEVAPGADVKGVKAIGPIQMRRPEAQAGERVVGIPVPITTENNFLIGLMRGDREARNVMLLRAPMIVDLPMQLTDGRAATISMEKGAAGERIFADAIDAWARP
ncbi:MAG: hypothetical protein HYS06_08795 [Methylocystis sp.]|nr:hypothetical protein [Methylocystis sp.]